MKRTALKDRILDHLKSGYTIDNRAAFARFGTVKLTSRISDLRQEGHPIKSEPTGTGHALRYWLEPS